MTLVAPDPLLPAGGPVVGAVLGYFGSKHRIAPWLISLMPDHQIYVEPFAGSLSVLARKPPSRIEVANDLDEHIITFWRVLRDRREDLEAACWMTPHARAELTRSLRLRPEPYDEVEHARRVWVRLAQGRASQLSSTGWRHHRTAKGTGSGMAARLDQYVGRFYQVADRIRGVSLECAPALEIIDNYGQDPSTLIYADPPYLGATRTGSRRGYAVEMLGPDAHVKLAEALHACRGSVLLSGYHSDLYADLYADWYRHEKPTWTGQGNQKAARVEVAWCNRPPTETPSLNSEDAESREAARRCAS